ncbi:hypothetical protein TcCL_ESM03101 [Trypanosoma cruzi]|uniref:Uncharacterized protein n=1 Tax=Trypanosoma cruzi (strain CL Brener) TaxID=353153 RepID=Q4CUW0_TRYCC|nr:hypothetical protein, conserved [Trypanosoma cruzi]EAN84066.1 hypothetical protein, conserved [Trypanosoma cruzi]RNC59296.1 hypothetical protein TcCL_ESM03101 [Trypanosoma cruzi]|eukprot:XP_805917.1 hypothetical protein [Trypanosoma cruzi strain CL Brener]
MLRRTLQFLLEQERPFTLRRAVMAKARPSHSSPGTKKGGTPDIRQNGHTGEFHDDAVAMIAQMVPNAVSPPPPKSSGALQPSKDQQHGDASEDAYRFLLHHIDSEIAALKRRITTVAKQRETVENNQSRRIRELFECIERPWLLLESIPAPQLPNKALEVYAKELYFKQHGADAGNCEQDAVFLDACRRNWRGLAIAQRKPYEIAARRNEHLRKELKKKISNGCSHFESFCEELKEWTAAMARNEMKPLSSSQASPRGSTPLAQKATKSPAMTTRKASASTPANVAATQAAVAVSSPKGGRTLTKRNSPAERRGPTRKKAVKNTTTTPTRVAAVRQRRQKPKLNRAHRAKAQVAKSSATKRKKQSPR